jgi:hypothetical protein
LYCNGGASLGIAAVNPVVRNPHTDGIGPAPSGNAPALKALPAQSDEAIPMAKARGLIRLAVGRLFMRVRNVDKRSY